MTTTIETVTTKQIRALRAEAATAGDTDLVAACETALEGPSAFGYGISLGACVRAISSKCPRDSQE